jgi:hypothetical protein
VVAKPKALKQTSGRTKSRVDDTEGIVLFEDLFGDQRDSHDLNEVVLARGLARSPPGLVPGEGRFGRRCPGGAGSRGDHVGGILLDRSEGGGGGGVVTSGCR